MFIHKFYTRAPLFDFVNDFEYNPTIPPANTRVTTPETTFTMKRSQESSKQVLYLNVVTVSSRSSFIKSSQPLTLLTLINPKR